MKTCAKCGIPKDEGEFGPEKRTASGLQARCRLCECTRGRVKDHRRYAEHHEAELARAADYRDHNREGMRERDRQRYWQDPEKNRARVRLYQSAHPERERLRRERDPIFRLRGVLRARLNTAIRNGCKAGSAVRDLGCPIPDLKKHLEALFQPGMSWENYGRRGWHIDHVRPLAKFDLADREQFLQACHYTNLQPLWAGDNLAKGAR